MSCVYGSVLGWRVISERVGLCTCELDRDCSADWLIGTSDDTDEAVQLAVCPVRREVVGL